MQSMVPYRTNRTELYANRAYSMPEVPLKASTRNIIMKKKRLTDVWAANRLKFEAFESMSTPLNQIPKYEIPPIENRLPYLPWELLLMVFAALGDLPQVVMIEKLTMRTIPTGFRAHPADAYRTRYSGGVPPTLHVSRLTRSEALKRYELLFGSVDQRPKFFDPSTDILFLKNCGSELPWEVGRYLILDLMKIQHLRISDRWNINHYWAPKLMHFENLKALTLTCSNLKHPRSSQPHVCSLASCESFRVQHLVLERWWRKMFNPVMLSEQDAEDLLLPNSNLAIPDHLLPALPELRFMDSKQMYEDVRVPPGSCKVDRKDLASAVQVFNPIRHYEG